MLQRFDLPQKLMSRRAALPVRSAPLSLTQSPHRQAGLLSAGVTDRGGSPTCWPQALYSRVQGGPVPPGALQCRWFPSALSGIPRLN